MDKKTRLVVIYGGKSAEHEISLISARHIIQAIDPNRYDIILVAIDPDGNWFLQPQPTNLEQPLTVIKENPCTLARANNKPLLLTLDHHQQLNFDIAFPVLHGPFGEDGTIQGLLKLLAIPFVGPGVLSSAVCMDKVLCKQIFNAAGIPHSEFVALTREQATEAHCPQLLAKLGLPCFVKPANMGSSVGISKVTDANALWPALQHALLFDQKIIIEKEIKGREIECAVLGNQNPNASIPGEIIPSHEFYSYEAKYLDQAGAVLQIPANLTPELTKHVQELALQAFKALDCQGMARVDFFIDANNKVYVNEVNTIPGFTEISMYPKLWQASGMSYSALIDNLVTLAFEAFDHQQSLRSNYQ